MHSSINQDVWRESTLQLQNQKPRPENTSTSQVFYPIVSPLFSTNLSELEHARNISTSHLREIENQQYGKGDAKRAPEFERNNKECTGGNNGESRKMKETNAKDKPVEITKNERRGSISKDKEKLTREIKATRVSTRREKKTKNRSNIQYDPYANMTNMKQIEIVTNTKMDKYRAIQKLTAINTNTTEDTNTAKDIKTAKNEDNVTNRQRNSSNENIMAESNISSKTKKKCSKKDSNQVKGSTPSMTKVNTLTKRAYLTNANYPKKCYPRIEPWENKPLKRIPTPWNRGPTKEASPTTSQVNIPITGDSTPSDFGQTETTVV